MQIEGDQSAEWVHLEVKKRWEPSECQLMNWGGGGVYCVCVTFAFGVLGVV
jgi:hypothetical protein